MTDRIFNMRLPCAYTGDENDIKQQETELLIDGMWKTFDLEMTIVELVRVPLKMKDYTCRVEFIRPAAGVPAYPIVQP